MSAYTFMYFSSECTYAHTLNDRTEIEPRLACLNQKSTL